MEGTALVGHCEIGRKATQQSLETMALKDDQDDDDDNIQIKKCVAILGNI